MVSPETPVIALLGDERAHPAHLELNALRHIIARELGVRAEWVPTDQPLDIRAYDGVWLVPGSPYRSDQRVLEALTIVRSEGIPFLGTCGGMQYAAMEFVRSVIGVPATHAETQGERADNVVSLLACSLSGEERKVVPVGGTRFASWVPEPFVGMHFCNYAPTGEAVTLMEAHGVVVGATADDAGAEVLEFPGHPFYVASMFQPQVGALAGQPVHPMIRAFIAAVTG